MKNKKKVGRKSTGLTRTVNINCRVTEEEKELIYKAKGTRSLNEFLIELIQESEKIKMNIEK